METEEEEDEGNDDAEEEDDEEDDGNGGGSGDEEDDGDDGKGDGGDEQEEEEEEEEQQQHPDVQAKKKKSGPNAPRSRHIPAQHLQLERLRGGKARGEPKDVCEFLFGYKSSWARTIYEIIDHKNVTRLFRRQSSYVIMSKWPLEGECARVREIVEKSGLYAGVEKSIIMYDKVEVSCFTERFYGETDTFLFLFGKMAVTPDDAEHILGLQMEGKSTGDTFKKNLPWKEIYVLTLKLFGWDEATTYAQFVPGKKYPKKEFKLKPLRKMYVGSLKKGGDNNLLSDLEVRATAAAYLLYALGSVIFPDNKGNRFSVNLLQPLDPLDEVSRYSRGTAIVAHLNAHLAKPGNELLKLTGIWLYFR